jgi:two-component system sensor histidine kinase VicK
MINSFIKKQVNYLTHFYLQNSIYLYFFILVYPIFLTVIYGTYLEEDFEYWFSIFILIFIQTCVIITITGLIFGFKDTVFVLTILIASMGSGALLIGLIIDKMYDVNQFDLVSVLLIIIIYSILISCIYRVYDYPKRIIPELDSIYTETFNYNFDFEIIHKVFLGDRLFGKIFQILNNIKQENKNNISRLTSVIEGISEGILILDNDFKIIKVNQTLINLYKTLFDSTFKKTREDLDVLCKNFLINLVQQSEINVSYSGEINKRFISIHQSFIEKTGQVIEIRDETDVFESVRVKKRIIETASHQIKTPLSIINAGTSNLIKYGNKLNEEQKQKISETIQDGITTINTILDNLTYLRDLDLKISFSEYKEIEIKEIYTSLLKTNEKMISKYEIEIVKDTSKCENLMLNLQTNALFKIINIIIDNAIKYSVIKSGKPQLIFESEFPFILNSKSGFLIKIQDNGVGIPEIDQNKIFSEFYRGTNVKDFTLGSGLGLVIAKRIIEKLGGEIWFTSQENIGSTFFTFFQVNEGFKGI